MHVPLSHGHTKTYVIRIRMVLTDETFQCSFVPIKMQDDPFDKIITVSDKIKSERLRMQWSCYDSKLNGPVLSIMKK